MKTRCSLRSATPIDGLALSCLQWRECALVEKDCEFVKRIAWITCPTEKLLPYIQTQDESDCLSPEQAFTPDDQVVVNCLRAHHYSVDPVEWGIDITMLHRYDMIVMRSPWDCMETVENRQRFVAWIEALQEMDIPIQNPAALMLWLLNKAYLKDFEFAGIPIVPSHIIKKGQDVDLEAWLDTYGQVILKPCISAGAQGLFCLSNREEIRSREGAIQHALADADYLIQPFISTIQAQGEWSLIYIEGEYSHAVHKMPAKDGFLIHTQHGGRFQYQDPPSEILHLGNQAAKGLPSIFQQASGISGMSPLYLRIDIIPGSEGPLLSECEGVEPALFFRANPGSEERFVKAMLRRFTDAYTPLV